MPKATSVTPGASGTSGRKATSTERNADKVVESAKAEAERIRVAARADAARIRAEAEEHSRRLVLDARATADGVRAEGMELVSHLRQMSDALRTNSERLLEDIQTIHSRMVKELRKAEGASGEAEALASDGPVEPEPAVEPPAEPSSEDELDVPDFVQRH